MNDPLNTYLHDHLAGATFAVEMLEAMKDAHPNEKVGAAARVLLIEIEADRRDLQRLVDTVSGNPNSLKEVASWIAEKAARLKLRRASSSALGTFETVEALALGIVGKQHLWRALAVAAKDDVRLRDADYSHLEERAKAQHAVVEELRLELVRGALVSTQRE